MNKLKESIQVTQKSGGGKYRIRLIREGEGSSGTYSEDVLREYGPIAWPKGTQCFMNHISESEMWDRPEGDVTKMLGVLESTPVFENDGLYADMRVFSHYADIVEEVFPYVGMSVKALHAAIDPETDEVLAILPHPLNSVDMVTVAGADGAVIERISESFKFGESAKVKNAKEITMDKDIQEAFDSVNGKVDAILEALDAATSADENVVSLAEAVKIVTKADLPEAAMERALEAHAAGKDLQEAVDAEKRYIDSLTSKETAGRVIESAREGKLNLGRFARKAA